MRLLSCFFLINFIYASEKAFICVLFTILLMILNLVYEHFIALAYDNFG